MKLWLKHGVAVTALAALAACSGNPGDKGATPAGPPGLPTNFTPPPPLGNPPEPNLSKPGLNYLRKLHVPLRLAWSSFLENCRLRLPPSHALNNPKLAARAQLLLTPKGKLHSVRLTSSSGNKDFDTAAVEVVRDAAPFAPAPPAFVSDDGLIHVTWLFARDVRQAGVASASVRRVRWPVERAMAKFLQLGDRDTAASRLADEVKRVNLSAAAAAKRVVKLGEVLSHAIIVAALGSDETALRRVGVGAANVALPDRARAHMRKLVRSSADPSTRATAALALGRFGDVDSIDLLLQVVDGKVGPAPQPSTIIAAVRALASMGKGTLVRSRIISWLDGPDKRRRRLALQVFAGLGAPFAASKLAQVVRRAKSPAGQRAAACLGLGRATAHRRDADGTDGAVARDQRIAMGSLRRGLKAADARVRAACAQGIAVAARAGVKSRATYWSVIKVLKDRDNHARAAATLAAARLEPKQFSKALYLFARERSPIVLASLAEGLSKVAGKLAYQRLVRLARHTAPRVRRAAAASLLVRPESGARRVVANMIEDNDVGVRLIALAVVDDEAVLTRLLAAKSPQLRAAALSRLALARGRAKTLPTLLDRLLAAKGQLLEQVRLAKAWLAPKS